MGSSKIKENHNREKKNENEKKTKNKKHRNKIRKEIKALQVKRRM